MNPDCKVPATETAYGRFRDDGWPLCPGCDEDELWSAALPATIETIVSCLRCGWRPLRPASEKTQPREEDR